MMSATANRGGLAKSFAFSSPTLLEAHKELVAFQMMEHTANPDT